MTHWYKYFILLLIPIVSGCGCNLSDIIPIILGYGSDSSDSTESESYRTYDVGDINGDGIQDSVALDRMAITYVDITDSAVYQDNKDSLAFLFSLYLGKGNNQYEQIKQCKIPLSAKKFSVTIPEKGRLEIDIDHLVFEYAFRDNELYLEKYEQDIYGADTYLYLDFTKAELRTNLYVDSFFYVTVPIPKYKRPSLTETTMEQSMTSMFMGKYLSYDKSFYDSLAAPYRQKSDSVRKEIIKELSTVKMSVVNHDTVLDMMAMTGELAMIQLYFFRKGLSHKLREAIKRDFLKMNSKYTHVALKATSFEEVFYECKKTWEKVNTRDEEGRVLGPNYGDSSESFLIKPIYENDHLITYLFKHWNNSCPDSYYLYSITYDKETAESFSWDMIRKDFLALLKEDILVTRPDIEAERIKFSACPPFIKDYFLGVSYQYYEITDIYDQGHPETFILLEDVEPYLTEKGRRFLRR
ncbi:MAG: hypothetical protein IJ916_08165 [Paludibacteraceae bacterium]|nr:hypothetical protein [Paludibacteraceae bacterium]